MAINGILIRFLQRHRKSKLPPCGEFQSRMNLVMMYVASISWDFPKELTECIQGTLMTRVWINVLYKETKQNCNN